MAPSPSIPPPGALPPPPPPPPPPPSLRRGNLNGPRDEQNGNDTENVRCHFSVQATQDAMFIGGV